MRWSDVGDVALLALTGLVLVGVAVVLLPVVLLKSRN